MAMDPIAKFKLECKRWAKKETQREARRFAKCMTRADRSLSPDNLDEAVWQDPDGNDSSSVSGSPPQVKIVDWTIRRLDHIIHRQKVRMMRAKVIKFQFSDQPSKTKTKMWIYWRDGSSRRGTKLAVNNGMIIFDVKLLISGTDTRYHRDAMTITYRGQRLLDSFAVNSLPAAAVVDIGHTLHPYRDQYNINVEGANRKMIQVSTSDAERVCTLLAKVSDAVGVPFHWTRLFCGTELMDCRRVVGSYRIRCGTVLSLPFGIK